MFVKKFIKLKISKVKSTESFLLKKDSVEN